MTFVHCWECMLEVTPSRRSVVIRMGPRVGVAPTDEARLSALCVSSRALRSNVEHVFGGEAVTLDPAPHPSLEQCAFRLSVIDPASGRCADCGRYAKEHSMTLDLDELERKAKVAAEWVNDPHAWNNGRLAPDVVLALIERVREMERLWAEESTARIRKLDLSTKDT